MNTPNLVSRLLEAITAKEEKAEAAKALHVSLNLARRNGKATLYAFLNDNDPSSVLRRCAADKALIADLQTDRHRGDPWICESVLNPDSACDCGRDERVARRLAFLAEAYGLEVTE